jgi:hypothetical protein
MALMSATSNCVRRHATEQMPWRSPCPLPGHVPLAFEEAYVAASQELNHLEEGNHEQDGDETVPPQLVIVPRALRQDLVARDSRRDACIRVGVCELLVVQVVDGQALKQVAERVDPVYCPPRPPVRATLRRLGRAVCATCGALTRKLSSKSSMGMHQERHVVLALPLVVIERAVNRSDGRGTYGMFCG